MAANEILNFCETNTGSNLLTQAEYLASNDRTRGNTRFAIAISKLVNKVLAQTCSVSSGVAQFVADNQNVDVTDQLLTAGMSDTVTHAIGNYIRQNFAVTFTSTGTGNALQITTTPFLYPAPITGTQIQIVANATNTGSTTLSIDGSFPTDVYIQSSTGRIQLQNGEITAGGIYRFIYIVDKWCLQNPSVKNLRFIGVSVITSTPQTVPGNNTGIRIIYNNAAMYDTHNFWNGTAQTLTIPFDGYYEMTASTFFKPVGTPPVSTVFTTIFINDAGAARLGEAYSGGDVTSTGDYKSFLNAGTTLALFANSLGGARNIGATGETSFFQVTYLGN